MYSGCATSSQPTASKCSREKMRKEFQLLGGRAVGAQKREIPAKWKFPKFGQFTAIGGIWAFRKTASIRGISHCDGSLEKPLRLGESPPLRWIARPKLERFTLEKAASLRRIPHRRAVRPKFAHFTYEISPPFDGPLGRNLRFLLMIISLAMDR